MIKQTHLKLVNGCLEEVNDLRTKKQTNLDNWNGQSTHQAPL